MKESIEILWANYEYFLSHTKRKRSIGQKEISHHEGIQNPGNFQLLQCIRETTNKNISINYGLVQLLKIYRWAVDA